MSEVLRIEDLAVEFRVAEGVIRAVNGVSFSVPRGGRVVAEIEKSSPGSDSIRRLTRVELPEPEGAEMINTRGAAMSGWMSDS